MLLPPLLLVATAGIAAPPDSLLPLVERSSMQVAWTQQALAHGAEGTAAVPACRPFAEDLVLCLTVPEGEGQRLVSLQDLDGWGLGQAEAERLALARVAPGVSPARPQEVQIQDDPRTYLLSAEGDGLDQAALFQPEALAARFAGKPFAVAIPARGVLIALPLGDPELEQMVAVGARRLWESADQPITSALYAWDGATWRVWGEARPAPPAPGPSSPQPGATP